VSSDGKDEQKGENHGGALQHEASLGCILGKTKVVCAPPLFPAIPALPAPWPSRR
jgi:hypothetical protein